MRCVRVKIFSLPARQAFTLVELLVVIAIVGMLSAVAVVSLNASRVQSRNAQRKANLVQLQKALELYYSVNNAYPSTSSGWWGVNSGYGSHDDSGANGWIPNLAPTYVAVLPRDPNTFKGNLSSALGACQTMPVENNYIYRSDGIDYKLLAHCIPEGTMATNDLFLDPSRTYWAWGVFTPGARNW